MASKGVNKVILVGNVGNKEVRATGDGKTIVNLSLATSETWKNQAGEPQEKTEWHKLVCFGKLADIVAAYVEKGTKLYVEGKLQTRKWQDNDGNDRYTTEIVMDQMQMLSSKGESKGESYEPSPQAAPQASTDFIDDDIPF